MRLRKKHAMQRGMSLSAVPHRGNSKRIDSFTKTNTFFTYMYDDAFVLFAEAKEDRVMYEKLMEFFKDELEAAENKGRAEGEAMGEAKGRAEGRAEREGLLKQIQALQNELMSLKAAMS